MKTCSLCVFGHDLEPVAGSLVSCGPQNKVYPADHCCTAFRQITPAEISEYIDAQRGEPIKGENMDMNYEISEAIATITKWATEKVLRKAKDGQVSLEIVDDWIVDIRTIAISEPRRRRMKYNIICNGKLIASFVNESDRNICMDTLAGMYYDCKFEGSEAEILGEE
ncbi:hypothetical protein ACFLQL_03035 [Verrucomicrobiota bacterium]